MADAKTLKEETLEALVAAVQDDPSPQVIAQALAYLKQFPQDLEKDDVPKARTLSGTLKGIAGHTSGPMN